MATAKTTSTNIDWSKPVCTKHARPLVGHMLPSIGPGPKRRLALPSLSMGNKAHEYLTVYRYGDDGVSRCDGAPSDFDLVNFNTDDGVDRMPLNPDVLKGQF